MNGPSTAKEAKRTFAKTKTPQAKTTTRPHPPKAGTQGWTGGEEGESPSPARRERARARVTGADKRAGHGNQSPRHPKTNAPNNHNPSCPSFANHAHHGSHQKPPILPHPPNTNQNRQPRTYPPLPLGGRGAGGEGEGRSGARLLPHRNPDIQHTPIIIIIQHHGNHGSKHT